MCCQFCGSEYDVLSLQVGSDENIEVCRSCYLNITRCGTCGEMHVYTVDMDYVDGKMICTNCQESQDLKYCEKCGKAHRTDGPLCRKCSRKYFKCEDCGQIKTFARSGLSEYTRLAYPSQAGVCKKCFNDKGFIPQEVEVKNCERCGTMHTNEGEYCDHCEEHKKICDHCGEVTFGYLEETADGKKVCGKCIASEEYFRCKVCHECHPKGAESSKYHHVCKECSHKVSVCDACGELRVTEDYEGMKLCNRCQEEHVRVCDVCGKSSILCLEGVCPECAFESGFSSVRSYMYKPPVKVTTKQPHYGIENEMSTRHYDLAYSYLGKIFSARDLIMKRDSSIDCGFECVFRPFTFDQFNKFDFSPIFNEKWFRESESCGMHIHINKTSFTTAHLYKFINFIFENQDFIAKIAEREPNSYCKKNRDKPTRVAKDKISSDRAQVNLQPRKTVELRMFAAATTEKQFRKNVEFVDALHNFARINNFEDSKSVDNFMAFVEKEKYPNLKAFLKGL